MPSDRHRMNKRILLTLLGCAAIGFAQPSVVSLAPLNGSGPTATFTSVYRHTGGVDQIYLAYLLILPTPNVVQYTATGSCLIEYNRFANGKRGGMDKFVAKLKQVGYKGTLNVEREIEDLAQKKIDMPGVPWVRPSQGSVQYPANGTALICFNSCAAACICKPTSQCPV